MDEIKLKPCPFCGGEAAAFEYGGSCWVRCRNCRVMTEVFYNVFTDNLTNTTVQQDGKLKALKAWNRRVNNG